MGQCCWWVSANEKDEDQEETDAGGLVVSFKELLVWETYSFMFLAIYPTVLRNQLYVSAFYQNL